MTMPERYQAMRDTRPDTILHVEFAGGLELIELRWLLDRALNCVEPKDVPLWATRLSGMIDYRLGIPLPSVPFNVLQAMLVGVPHGPIHGARPGDLVMMHGTMHIVGAVAGEERQSSLFSAPGYEGVAVHQGNAPPLRIAEPHTYASSVPGEFITPTSTPIEPGDPSAREGSTVRVHGVGELK